MPDHQPLSYEGLLYDFGCSKKVIAHCRAVRDCALEYARHDPDADYALIETGSLLHDIGRGTTHSVQHAQTGADLLRSKGFSEAIARVVECHTGAGITADECTLLGLKARDCIPRTTEEKIVAHADNLIAGKRRVTIDESIASAIYLPKKARKRMYRLACDVELLCSSRI